MSLILPETFWPQIYFTSLCLFRVLEKRYSPLYLITLSLTKIEASGYFRSKHMTAYLQAFSRGIYYFLLLRPLTSSRR